MFGNFGEVNARFQTFEEIGGVGSGRLQTTGHGRSDFDPKRTLGEAALPGCGLGPYLGWMADEEAPEFTHEQGLAVGGLALLFGIVLLFVGEQWAELGTIALGAIATTVFIQRHLLRHWWFLTFIAVMVIAHLGLVLALPWTDLERGSFKLVALGDVVGVLGLAFSLEKLASLRR